MVLEMAGEVGSASVCGVITNGFSSWIFAFYQFFLSPTSQLNQSLFYLFFTSPWVFFCYFVTYLILLSLIHFPYRYLEQLMLNINMVKKKSNRNAIP